MKKLLLTSLILLTFAKAFAADATVTFVKGKVEVLKGNDWVALNQGDELSKADVINTGFNSEAKIKLFDSVMYLGPVTRVSLDELSASSGQDKVSVYLKTGNVRSQVNHTESKRVNYQVRTAVAVASVRGTDWSIDDSNNITCFAGAVASASVRALTPAASENMEEAEELPDDGVLVQANQSLEVSDSNFTSTPVNTVVQAATEVSSGVAKAASKEAVAPTTSVAPTAVATPVAEVIPVPAEVKVLQQAKMDEALGRTNVEEPVTPPEQETPIEEPVNPSVDESGEDKTGTDEDSQNPGTEVTDPEVTDPEVTDPGDEKKTGNLIIKVDVQRNLRSAIANARAAKAAK